MNEKGFITKIHKRLNKGVYRWKINDPYHGGVPDTYYSGPSGFCFVEYKYIPRLPVRETSKLNFGLSKQQELWLITQYKFGIPVFVAAGCEDNVVLTEDFELVNHYTRQEFLEEATSSIEFIQKLEQHCLGEK